jgi:hypothetical protein
MQELRCPSCQHGIQVSEELVGRIARCRGCQARLAIERASTGELALRLAPAPAVAAAPQSTIGTSQSTVGAAGSSASVPCPSCRALLRANETFCTSCGAPVSAESRAAIAARSAEMERVSRRRNARQKIESTDRTRRVRRAAKVILWLGILFCLGGLGMGFLTQKEAEEARRVLSTQYEPDEEIEIEGETWVVKDLLAQVDLETQLAFVVPIGLGVLMFGLYFWALRAALPATITALSVFLVIQVASGIVDPKSLLQGLLLKGVAVVFLIGGIRAALAERAAEAADARRRAREAASA